MTAVFRVLPSLALFVLLAAVLLVGVLVAVETVTGLGGGDLRC